MTKEEFLKLVDRYLIDDISPEEEDLLISFIESFREIQEWDEELFGVEKLLEEKMERELKVTLMGGEPSHGNFYTWWKIAAAVLFFLSIGGLLYKTQFSNAIPIRPKQEIVYKSDLAPGGDIATLTLADGSVVNLSDSSKSDILLAEGFVAKKNDMDQLVYDVTAGSNPTEIQYNTLSTPKGGQYQVVLPDGTKVWLNSESSLRFPTAFVGTERKVDLLGEAYFEVAKNRSKAFKVNVKGMEVMALGTQFNITAYQDEETISTTLFEGSVNVSKESKSVLLKPGQQAKLNTADGVLKSGPADLEAEIAWKKGYFVFNSEDIQSIMVKLSRWYDADIEYVGNVADEKFTLIISRRSNISEILEILEATGTIHFKIDGRRVTVMA